MSCWNKVPKRKKPNKQNFHTEFNSNLVRSQSVGPTVCDRSGSPKKQTRSGSTTGVKSTKRTPVSTPTVTAPQDGRRPRPSK